MKCPICDHPTKPFDLNALSRPTDPVLFRLAQTQRVCPRCGWQSDSVEEVKLRDLLSDVRPAAVESCD